MTAMFGWMTLGELRHLPLLDQRRSPGTPAEPALSPRAVTGASKSRESGSQRDLPAIFPVVITEAATRPGDSCVVVGAM
jgi:hypothetical protein